MRYSTLPPLKSATVLPTSLVTVPVFGFGIRPRGPSTRPSLPTWPIRSGVAIATSKSTKPFWIAVDEIVGADDVGAGFLRLARRVTRGEHGDAHVLAGAGRQRHGAAQHLVGLAGIDTEPERRFDGLVEVAVRQLLHEVERLLRLVQTLAVVTAGCVGVLLAGHDSLLQAPS